MLLYHGSSVGDITALEPRQSGHDKPYVYLTDNVCITHTYYGKRARQQRILRPMYMPYNIKQRHCWGCGGFFQNAGQALRAIRNERRKGYCNACLKAIIVKHKKAVL